MNKSVVLELVKSRLGITSTVRDEYILSIIKGIISELEKIHGITLVSSDDSHLMFVADYAEYRYSNRENPVMPRHLQWRLHNLMMNGGA